jgi:hypothetical protein
MHSMVEHLLEYRFCRGIANYKRRFAESTICLVLRNGYGAAGGELNLQRLRSATGRFLQREQGIRGEAGQSYSGKL